MSHTTTPAATAAASPACTSCRACRHHNEPCTRTQNESEAELSIMQAIEVTALRRDLLAAAAKLLADIARLTPATDGSDNQFEALLVQLEQIGRTQFQGEAVFRRTITVVHLEDDSANRLVLPGIDLAAGAFRRLATTGRSDRAISSQKMEKARRLVAMDQALVSESLTRLTFLAQGLETVKESLHD